MLAYIRMQLGAHCILTRFVFDLLCVMHPLGMKEIAFEDRSIHERIKNLKPAQDVEFRNTTAKKCHE